MTPPRRHISTTERARIFERHGGVCDICGGRIGAVEGWDVSHRIPLALGGADDPSNWFPVHRKCHRSVTAEQDAPAIAKAKRRAAAHIGAKAPSRRPLPGGRASKFKKKLNGEVVPR